MDAIVSQLNTLDDLNEWSELWGMQNSDLVNLRRIQILSELANNCVVTEANVTCDR